MSGLEPTDGPLTFDELRLATRNRGVPLEALRYEVTPGGLHYLLTHFDVMLGKSFRTGDRLRIEFRAEAFNVANTPPLGAPNNSFGNAAFGSITTALDPRVFELVLKLHF